MKQLLQKISSVLQSGKLDIQIFTVLKGGKDFPIKTQIANIINDKIIHLYAEYQSGIIEDLFFEFAENNIVCKRQTTNHSNAVLELIETGVDISGLCLGALPENDYFYHNENPRIYDKLTIPLDLHRGDISAATSNFDTLAGNRWCDPGVITERIGASPYQPFPAILLSNYQSKHGIVHGTLSQKVFYHNYLCGHRNGSAFLTIHSGFKAVAWREVAVDESICDVWYLGYCECAEEYEKIFDAYVTELKKHLPPMWGATAINRHSLAWGSWNDGIWRNIQHDDLLKTADFISGHYPTVTFMQIDDGYARFSTEQNVAHGLGMPYEGNAGLDHDKFPEGLKSFTNAIKERGLRPAIWIGGLCPRGSKIFDEKPEWRAKYDFRLPNSMVLDVSRADVREYMLKALDYFFNEAGFEAMKHDFWSYAFEDSHDLLQNKHRSGYEWRYWWLSEIRKRIPDDAYLQTGCDIVMGNPFLGEFFTNYRYGIDIGSGNWDHVKTNFLWGAACFATHTGDLFVPNSDSVGLFPGLSDVEAQLCLNYCLISRSMVELAGRLHDVPENNPRINMLKRVICCPHNGQDVYFSGFDYRTQNSAPEKWFIKTPYFSRIDGNPFLPCRTLAIFNLSKNVKSFELPFFEMGLREQAYLVTEVWESQVMSISNTIKIELQPHSSILLAINNISCDPQILDCDLKIDKVFLNGNILSITFGHSGEYTLMLSQRPSSHMVIENRGGYIVKGRATANIPEEFIFS